MDLCTGGYRTANPNAAFFLRSEESLAALPEEFVSRFKDQDVYSQRSLATLKVRAWLLEEAKSYP